MQLEEVRGYPRTGGEVERLGRFEGEIDTLIAIATGGLDRTQA